MTGAALQSFIARSQSVIDSSPPTDRPSTRVWLVDPLLETLGWNVHADSCTTDTTIDGTPLEYVLEIDGVPAFLVAVEPAAATLDQSRAVSLLETMTWSGIDRALYTNGHEFIWLADSTGTTGTGTDTDTDTVSVGVDHLVCDLASLADHATSVDHFTRSTIAQQLDPSARSAVARQLALERRAVVDALVAELVSTTRSEGDRADELEALTDRFVEQLIVVFADDDSHVATASEDSAEISFQFTDSSTADSSTADSSTADSSTADSSTADSSTTDEETPGTRTGTATPDAKGSSTNSGTDRPAETTESETETVDIETESGTETETETTDGDGSYVVRFFNDRGSIGAIGHSSSRQALVQAAEYLFERGLSGVAVPWQPPDGERTVLNDEPIVADGSPMESPQQLSNGLYLETAGTADEHAARVESLTARAGLRAMLTEAWA
ncbi:hypothetical protein [Natrialba sp. PRR66]|uniref:hypothetical protein n=1 Tax=Natrialba sp. PRR66 TaxID=3098146 RepID=UPI002B1DDC2A|nr:hypothetical protein [Natrialba sp. PRR66]